MIRRLSLLCLLIFALSSAGLHWARQWGQQIEPAPTFLEVYDCPLPCWTNLRPQVHTTTAFWAVLKNVQQKGGWMYSGYVSSRDENGDLISEFQLDLIPSPQIRLGDALLLYGAPEAIRIVPIATLARGAGGRRLILEVYLYWADGQMQLAAVPPTLMTLSHLRPEMWVRQIVYREPTPTEEARPWRGFGIMPPQD